LNRCYSGKAISVTYSECVLVALVIQHTMRLWHIVICSLPDSAKLFSHYLINRTMFEKKIIEHEMCVVILYTSFVRNISHSKKN